MYYYYYYIHIYTAYNPMNECIMCMYTLLFYCGLLSISYCVVYIPPILGPVMIHVLCSSVLQSLGITCAFTADDRTG